MTIKKQKQHRPLALEQYISANVRISAGLRAKFGQEIVTHQFYRSGQELTVDRTQQNSGLHLRKGNIQKILKK